MTPRLSIITSVYNHAEYLPECIASVREQTETQIEHIIVIDGATDQSEAVADLAAQLDDRLMLLVNSTNRGLAYSLNRAIANVRAPWVMKVDADDKIAPTYVETILRAAINDPLRNIIFSPARHFGTCSDVYRYPMFDATKIVDQFMLAGCAAIRRDVWAAVEGYDESMRYAEDWDLYVRAQQVVGLVPHQLPEPLWFYRQHAGVRASDHGIARLHYLKAYWRGHTRESVLARARTWGDWCAERGVAA